MKDVDTPDRIARCIDILERVYGVPGPARSGPVDLLVTTILSQNTTSANTHRSFAQLKKAYPDYESLLEAPDYEVADHIREGGLANIKAGRIKAALEKIKKDTGSIDLAFLKDMEVSEARDYLISLPGVGPKTASVVLLFSFGMSLMPVDTHVNRLSRRLGFVPQKVSIEEAQHRLEEMTPREKYCSLHVNLIRHGRAVCKARSPHCDECVLREICLHPSLSAQKG